MLCYQALNQGSINVFGGEQTRLNIHIEGMARVFLHFINNSDIESGSYNAGFENISIIDLANVIAQKIPAEIKVTESNDIRSYQLNSDKLLATGFVPKFGISDALDEITLLYRNNRLSNDPRWHTVDWMKECGLGG